MDPQACFAKLTSAIEEGDYEEAFYHCNDMINWITQGGHDPVIKVMNDERAVPIAFFRNLRHMLKRSQGGSSLA